MRKVNNRFKLGDLITYKRTAHTWKPFWIIENKEQLDYAQNHNNLRKVSDRDVIKRLSGLLREHLITNKYNEFLYFERRV